MPGEPLSLLVVGRSAAARQAVCQALQAVGCACQPASRASQARRQWNGQLFHAILFVSGLPGKTPRGVLDELDGQGYSVHTLFLLDSPNGQRQGLSGICAMRLGNRKEVLKALQQAGAAVHDLLPTDSSVHERYRKLLNRFDEGYWELSPDGVIVNANWSLHRMSGHSELIGKPIWVLFEGAERVLLRSMLEQHRAGIYLAFTTTLTTADERKIPVQIDPFPLPGAARHQGSGALIRPAPGYDDPHREEDQLRERALEVLYLVATALTQPAPLEQSLDEALLRLLEMLSLDGGVIWILGEDGHLSPVATRGLVADPERRWALMSAIRAWCQPAAKVRWCQVFAEGTDQNEKALGQGGFHGGVAIPMGIQERRVGVLWVATRNPRHFNKDLISLLISVGQQIALAVEHARMYESRLQEEKARREFYRNTVSAVTRGKLTLVEPEELDEAWETGEPLAELDLSSIADVGRARHLVEQCCRRLDFPQERTFDVVTCVSEAATNALHYGKGGWVGIKRVDDAVRVRVSDQGPGIQFYDLPRAVLMQGYSTGLSLGLGYSLILELMDAVLLATAPGRGTSILMEMRRIAPEPPLPSLDDWADKLGVS